MLYYTLYVVQYCIWSLPLVPGTVLKPLKSPDRASLVTHNDPPSAIPEFLLMRWLWMGPRRASGWGLVTRGTNNGIRGLELSIYHPQPRPRGRGKGWRFFIANGQWLNQPCLCNETSINAVNDRVWGTSQLVLWRLTYSDRAWNLNSTLPAPLLPRLPPSTMP